MYIGEKFGSAEFPPPNPQPMVRSKVALTELADNLMGALIPMFHNWSLRQWTSRRAVEHPSDLDPRTDVNTETISHGSGNTLRESSTGCSSVAQELDDEITSRLAQIWRKLLHVESISIDENYFDLGGDSSLTIQLFVQIEKTFGVKLPVLALFEAPTVGELATAIRDAKSCPPKMS